MTSPKVIRINQLNVDIIPPSSKSMYNSDQGGSKIVVIGKPGCFTKGTQILMADMTVKNVEDIKLNDQVMGDNGKPRLVLELCHNSDEMFEIIPKQGVNYTVNKKHKLVLFTSSNKIIEISIDELLKKNIDNYRLIRTGINFPSKSVPIEPYLFGMWLGDHIYTTNCANGQNSMLQALNKYNLINKKKYIPSDYKINDTQTRKQLLDGILDSIGFYNETTNTYEFSLKQERLIDDCIYICRSLGFYALKHKMIQNKIEYYRCIIKGNIAKPTPATYILSQFTIKAKGEGEYFGFTIDGNHRFLLESFDIVRNTGKTTLISSLLYEKKNIFPIGMVMCGTEDSNGYYRKIFPSTFVYNKLREDKITDFVKRQKIAKNHLQNPWAVLLLDDCTDDPKIFSKPLFHSLYKNGRHWKMWYILSLQYCMDIKPVIRTNIDGTFILREPSLKNRRALWENYAGIIPDFSTFCDVMDQITDDYTALYINNATQSNRLEDCVFWYKAKMPPKGWKFGSKDFWAFHGKRYDKTYREPYY